MRSYASRQYLVSFIDIMAQTTKEFQAISFTAHGVPGTCASLVCRNTEFQAIPLPARGVLSAFAS